METHGVGARVVRSSPRAGLRPLRRDATTVLTEVIHHGAA